MKSKSILLVVITYVMTACQSGNNKNQDEIGGINRIKDTVREYMVKELGSPNKIEEICNVWESDTLSYEIALKTLKTFQDLDDFIPNNMMIELNKPKSVIRAGVGTISNDRH